MIQHDKRLIDVTGINEGRIKFFDKHLSMFPVDLMYGYYTMNKPTNKLDVVIVEASAITEEGGIIPGASVGASPELIQMADKVLYWMRYSRLVTYTEAAFRLLLKLIHLCRLSKASMTLR